MTIEEKYDNAFAYVLFLEKVKKAKEEFPKFRWGQHYWLVLVKENEKLARKIYETELDPYPLNIINEEIHRFVLENWR
jgi:hypothetical protein